MGVGPCAVFVAVEEGPVLLFIWMSDRSSWMKSSYMVDVWMMVRGTYIPCFGTVPSLGDIVDSFAVSAEEEDFIFGVWGREIVQVFDVFREFLPLGEILENL